MEISSVGIKPITTTDTQTQSEVQQQSAPAVPQQKAVSDEWQQLNNASAQLQELPEIDTSKIAQLQAELATEGYPIDIDKIAEAMFEQHSGQK